MKLNKKYIFGVLFVICSIVCFITGCFSSSKSINTQNIQEKKIQKTDYSRFVVNWNKQVYYIKDHEYSKFKTISLEKYILKNDIEDISKKLKIFLQFEDNNLQQLTKIKNLKFSERFYLPVIMWIDNRNKIKFSNIDQKISQSELEENIAKTISDPYFSVSTIDKIIQLNEFCYYFKKNKNLFLKKGFSKNITKCEYIQKILDLNKIELKIVK